MCASVKIAVTLFLCEVLLTALLGKKRKALYVMVSAVVIFAGTVPLVNNITQLTWLIRSPLTFVFYFTTVCIIPVAVMAAEKYKERVKRYAKA